MVGISISHLQFRHQIVVGLGVLAFQILHELSAFAHLFDESAARAEVLLMHAEVLGKVFDFRGENGDLHLRRTGIGFVSLVLFDDPLLFLRRQHTRRNLAVARDPR